MIKDLYTLMLKYNFKPSHKLDQNFIVDDSVILRVIKELELKKTDVVVEVGPGTGFLTKKLLDTCNQVIAIEKDKKMIDILEKEFIEQIKKKKLVVVCSDFLTIDLSKYNYTKIATFLPYSISQEFIEKILGEKKLIVGVVQKEFAEKLISIPGFINYNAVSVLSQSYFEITKVKTISKKCFFPVPSCESAIIKLIPNKKELDAKYNGFIKNIFRYPNKDISNALHLVSRDLKNRKISEKSKELDTKILDKKVRQIEIKELEKIYSVVY